MPKLTYFNPNLIAAIRQLYFWQYNSGESSPSFYSLLFYMFQKADLYNEQRLRKGFPEHHMAWTLWKESHSQDKFFENWLGDDFCKERGFDGTI